MVDDFINGNRVSLENPRWINKIGYVNKLHPAHENEGQEISTKITGMLFRKTYAMYSA